MKPVIKCSICNGEQVAGFQDIHTGIKGLTAGLSAMFIIPCTIRNMPPTPDRNAPRRNTDPINEPLGAGGLNVMIHQAR